MLKKEQNPALIRKKLRPDLEYMTDYERVSLQRLAKSGSLSVFRIAKCIVCDDMVIKSKDFCSLECFQKYENRTIKERLIDIFLGEKKRRNK